MKNSDYIKVGTLGVLILALFFADIKWGSVAISWSELMSICFDSDPSVSMAHQLIILDYRLPKAVTALFGGGALAVGGLLMQSYFKNPLAGPYVLGIGSGASLGVAIFLMGMQSAFLAEIPEIIQSAGIVLSAFLGAVSILLVIGFLSIRFKSDISLLLLGLMLSYFVSALVSLLQFWADADMVKQFVIWGMGTFGNTDWNSLQIIIPLTLLGLILAYSQVRALDAFYLGREEAESLGISIRRSRTIIMIATGLLVGLITAYCGPVAFLGLAVPHFVRLAYGYAGHRWLLPLCFLSGGALALLFDLISQNPFGDSILPLNTIASIVGAPTIIYLLFKNYQMK